MPFAASRAAFVSDVEDKAVVPRPRFLAALPHDAGGAAVQPLQPRARSRLRFRDAALRDCYFYFAYPFLLAVPGYNVRAVPLPDAERDRNLEMLRFISDEAARRGLHFQLGLWTHAYQWTKQPGRQLHHRGADAGDPGALLPRRPARAAHACPAISGVTFRIHGESGVPEGNYGILENDFRRRRAVRAARGD